MSQRWFADWGHPRAGDPYFLYAGSNLGSLRALLGYSVWIEPHLRLVEQTRLWTWGYVALVAMVAGCAGVLWKRGRGTARLSTTSALPFQHRLPLLGARVRGWRLISDRRFLKSIPSSRDSRVTTGTSRFSAIHEPTSASCSAMRGSRSLAWTTVPLACSSSKPSAPMRSPPASRHA